MRKKIAYNDLKFVTNMLFMNTLKLKILDVLTGNISTQIFENWLYNSETIINKMDTNRFFFELVTINYKKEDWSKDLEEILLANFTYDDFLTFLIASTSYKLSKSKHSSQSYKILNNSIAYFEYDTNYDVLRKLYALYLDYDLFTSGVYSEIEFNNFIDCTSNDILKSLSTCNTFEETKQVLLSKFNTQGIIIKPKKKLLKDKILAFLKKS